VNSRDATPGHGTIAVMLDVRAHVEGFCASCHENLSEEFVTLTVADSGGGIPPDTLERIFDPFFTTKGVGEGTGIGLSVVDGIVHRHGGHVRVSSQAGVGTQMQILFPRATVPGPPGALASAESVDDEPRPGVRGKLLVVDYEPWVAAFLSELLRTDGYEVELFNNGLDALDALDSASPPFDAVVSDFMMPHMTGLELASAIHSRHPGLPVVLCTGAGEPPDPQTLQRAGVRHLFPKPVPVEELQKLLVALLSSPGAGT
jgi:CheY-like chemotaxis protein